MTGLIYKDFLALKGHLTTYLVFFLVYGGLCLSGVFTASVLCGMVVLMSLITPMTTVTSDDVSRWNRFAIATPACRRGVVTGKYLFTLLVTLASTVFVSLLLVVLALAGGLEAMLDHLASRMAGSGGFPHEVGLFLGYPAEDVEGFRRHGGQGYKYSGLWKVYSDVERAQRCFRQYGCCRRALCRRLEAGCRLVQLFRTA